MAEYFFELLTEEIPAWMHDAVQNTLREKLAPFGGTVTVTTTPRRIIFFLAGLVDREEDRVQEVKGPPKKAAYDASGNPTQALNGFLKKNNAAITDVLDGGDYVLVRRNIAGRGTDEILRERVPEIIESLRWPKMMRWGKGEHSYIRPIHSVVSVYDGKPLPITIFGIASGKTTVGHRTLAPQKIEVGSYNEYVHKLEAARVIVDVTRRRHVMAERARVLANQAGGTPAMDASIWSQWQYLTEYPGIVRAEFRRDYLALPEEVLVTVMRVHQKQLPIRDAHGHLTHSFLAVLDNEGDPDGNAAYGNSFVTNARFADAQFFYETDRKRPLESRLEQLEHLQFQEKLGNYRRKTERIVEIARALGADEATLTAASLCKTDLVTEMVKEFTDLQGKIGGIYARDEKYPTEVWQAIYDHYLPVNVEDPLPRTRSGAIVALADKIDTVAGFFSIGVRPTGSKDPFALRRAAQGVVQILLNRDKRRVQVKVSDLFDIALRFHDAPKAKGDLVAFFSERVQTILETSAYGFAYDEIQAAMEGGWEGYLPDLVDRIEAVKAVRNDADFLSILDSAKRIANITEGHPNAEVAKNRLENEAEKRLNDLADTVGEQVRELIADRKYRDALRSFAGMAPELETFFKEVMVNVDDPAIANNRKALLRKIGAFVAPIADVTKIVVARRDYRP
jgi:glycyl-tRNA synthetase beta chain